MYHIVHTYVHLYVNPSPLKAPLRPQISPTRPQITQISLLRPILSPLRPKAQAQNQPSKKISQD